MRRFIAWVFGITSEHVDRTYYHCYGEGCHANRLGDEKRSNPYTYGTLEYDAWNDGWDGRK